MIADFDKGTKVCCRCKEELPISEYCKSAGRRDGLNTRCKKCDLKWREDNKAHLQHYRKQFYQENYEGKIKEQRSRDREKINTYDRSFRKEYNKSEKGKEVILKCRKKRVLSGAESLYCKNKRKTDSLFSLREKIRGRIWSALNGRSKSDHTFSLLGCPVEELKEYLELQFTEGMTWENYGKDGWHIDHIIPCSYFDLSIEENQKICFNFRNLQPLWASENCSKNDKVPENVEELVEYIKGEL